jgi:hypothetical protein
MVADLGLGKSMEVSSRLTVIAGTPSFVAPEQAQGEPLDARADQYSLAALTYLMLASRAAFSHASLAAAATPGPPPPLSTEERPYPPEVETVVCRGLAADREDRWPDVASYVAALEDALGPAAGTDAELWLPLDPQLTQLGAAPSLRVDDGPLPEPALPRRTRRRWLVALAAAAAVVVVAAGVAGYVAAGDGPDTATVSDEDGALTVTVPTAWEGAVADDGWQPPDEKTEYPALSVGTDPGWSDDPDAQGVFVGILAGTELPARVPGHPECATAQEPVNGDGTGRDAVTVFYTGCGDGVMVERVVRLTDNRLLWVQVRSATTATANQVLDSVETHGFS